jgi:putative FmdB family regulatory protein
MPLYTRVCPECDYRFDVMRSIDFRNDPVECIKCETPTKRGVELPAFTPSGWGDSKWAGRYDKGLGVTLQSKKHRDQIMKQRGLVEDTVIDQRTRLDKSIGEAAEHERTVARFNAELSNCGGDRGLAIANTFPSDP